MKKWGQFYFSMCKIGGKIELTPFFLIFILGLWGASPCFAISEARAIKKGNKFYKEANYEEALKRYNVALTKSPNSSPLNFDIGTAQYKKGEYEKAGESFLKALLADDKDLLAKANYNIGNCKYRQGEQRGKRDLAAAVGLWREALAHYKKALALNEKDEDAKFNHKFVEKKLKAALEKLKEQQKEAEGKQEMAGETKEKATQKQNGMSVQEESKEAEKKGAEKEAGQMKEGGEGKSAQGEEEKKEGIKRDEAGREAEARGMSGEEANMLLEGYRQREGSQGALDIRREGGRYSEVVKDW